MRILIKMGNTAQSQDNNFSPIYCCSLNPRCVRKYVGSRSVVVNPSAPLWLFTARQWDAYVHQRAGLYTHNVNGICLKAAEAKSPLPCLLLPRGLWISATLLIYTVCVLPQIRPRSLLIYTICTLYQIVFVMDNFVG